MNGRNVQFFPEKIIPLFENRYHDPQILEKQASQIRSRLSDEVNQISLQSTACPLAPEKVNQDKIDYSVLYSGGKYLFFSSDFMKLSACSIYAIFYGISYDLNPSDPNYEQEMLKHELLYNYIESLRTIGEASAYGSAMTGKINGVDNLFVVKVPQDEGGIGDLAHETYVGLFGTNQLRNHIPNFSYVYGGFRCSKPVIEGKKVVSWCNKTCNSLSMPYAIYENIFPSESISEFVRKNDDPFAIMSIIMQTLFSLKKAHDLIDFTHYDLHTGNALLRYVQDSNRSRHVEIKYDGMQSLGLSSNKNPVDTFYVNGPGIVTIIDYGRSGFRTPDGTYHGPIDAGSDSQNYYSDKSWILGDAYRFLMYMAFDLGTTEKKSFKIFEVIYRFFNSRDPLANVIGPLRTRSYFTIPLDNVTSTVTIEELIRYILSSVDLKKYILEVVKAVPTKGFFPVYQRGNIHWPINRLFNNNSDGNPFLFYHKYLSSEKPEELKIQYQNRYLEGDNMLRVRINVGLVDLVNSLSKTETVDPQLNLNLLDPYLLGEIKAIYASVYHSFYLFQRVQFWISLRRKLYQLYSSSYIQYIADEIAAKEAELLALKRNLLQKIDYIRSIYSYIYRTLSGNMNLQDQIRRDHNLSWYITSAGDVASIGPECVVKSLKDDKVQLPIPNEVTEFSSPAVIQNPQAQLSPFGSLRPDVST